MHMHIHTYTHTLIHTHAHTHMHTHINTHTCTHTKPPYLELIKGEISHGALQHAGERLMNRARAWRRVYIRKKRRNNEMSKAPGGRGEGRDKYNNKIKRKHYLICL